MQSTYCWAIIHARMRLEESIFNSSQDREQVQKSFQAFLNTQNSLEIGYKNRWIPVIVQSTSIDQLANMLTWDFISVLHPTIIHRINSLL